MYEWVSVLAWILKVISLDVRVTTPGQRTTGWWKEKVWPFVELKYTDVLGWLCKYIDSNVLQQTR